MTSGLAADRSRALLDEHGPELLRSVVQRFGTARMRACGTSMLPSIEPGDILIVEKASLSSLTPNHVIVFQWRDRVLAHRVITVDAGPGTPAMTTRGDNHTHVDPPVTDDELIGRVVEVVRDDRLVPIEQWECAPRRGVRWWD